MSATEPNFFAEKPKALVTGATGFLGGHVIDKLLNDGWQVYALCRNKDKAVKLNKDVNIINGDVTQRKALLRDVPQNLDALFHTAASTNTWAKKNHMQTRTNVEGMQNLIELCKKNSIRKFIHVSSVVVYGLHAGAKIHQVTENSPKAGENSWVNYVKTKTQAEKILLAESQIHKVIVNPTHIIGPGDRHNWARLIQMIAHEKLPSIPNGSGSFVDVRDVASSIVTAFEQGADGHNYLLGGTNLEFKEFIYQIAKTLDVPPTKVQLPNFLLKLLAQIKQGLAKITGKEPDITPESVALISDRYSCDSAKAKAELNHSIRPLTNTLADTLEFLKAEKLIP